MNEAERKFLPIDMFGGVTDASLWKWLTRRVAQSTGRLARIGSRKAGYWQVND